MKTDAHHKKNLLKNAGQVVVKVGTRLLTDRKMVSSIIAQISGLRDNGLRVLLVSSGAVGTGMKTLGIKKRPGKISDIQALAAIGQSKLMTLYERECRKHGFHAAQLLLSGDDLRDRERHLNVLNCIHSLWNRDVLPVINENDSVSVDELKLGDNDTLAALVSVMTRSPLAVVLTTVDGFHRSENGLLRDRIPVVGTAPEDLLENAVETADEYTIGGIYTKLKAARIVVSAGESFWIADGRDPDILSKIYRGEDVGTLFLPRDKQLMPSRKRWLSFFSDISGSIVVDAGAEKALLKYGRSLLPSGISKVNGSFKRGDTIEIFGPGRHEPIAKGLANYSSGEIRRIAGVKSSEIPSVLGYSADDEVVHRNNMVLS